MEARLAVDETSDVTITCGACAKSRSSPLPQQLPIWAAPLPQRDATRPAERTRSLRVPQRHPDLTPGSAGPAWLFDFLSSQRSVPAAGSPARQDSPARLCNAYLLDDQMGLGRILVGIAVTGGLAWLAQLVIDMMRRRPRPLCHPNLARCS